MVPKQIQSPELLASLAASSIPTTTPRELPELPEAREFMLMNDHDFKAQKVYAFSANQMRAFYARGYAAAEQELATRLAESEARAERDARDAARYRWLRDVPNCSLSVARNEGHAPNYMTLSDWIEASPEWYEDVPAAELALMKESNTDWCVQIYPDTPIGFYTFHGATLDAAIDAAIAQEAERDAASA